MISLGVSSRTPRLIAKAEHRRRTHSQPTVRQEIHRQADLRLRASRASRSKKTLGPVALTALGIGAIIGSGIFVLTGTAAAGEHFELPSILHAQVLDLVANLFQHGNISGVLMHGRPPAGPAIAISFILVAIACSFAGLCYAELASMIPIAGSAYTYTYATLGEMVAWIIGWDLILEYAVSNMAVASRLRRLTSRRKLESFGINMPMTDGPRPSMTRRPLDGRLLQSCPRF